jgi:hypothetical protein
MRKLLLLFAIGVSSVTAAQETLPPPFPRANATKLLETDRIVIWNIVWPKGQPTAMHRHVYDQVGTYYARGGRTITQPDGTARPAMTEVGALSTTKKGTTHIEEGTTDPPLRAIFIELKQERAAAPTGAAVAALPGWKEIYDEPRVRVWDVRLPGLADLPLSGAPGGSVLVFLDPGKAHRTDAMGKSADVTVEPGTMRYIAPGSREIHAAISGSPRVMVFELK